MDRTLQERFFVHRFLKPLLSLLVSLNLLLPFPALALRPTIEGNESGLEEVLRPPGSDEKDSDTLRDEIREILKTLPSGRLHHNEQTTDNLSAIAGRIIALDAQLLRDHRQTVFESDERGTLISLLSWLSQRGWSEKQMRYAFVILDKVRRLDAQPSTTGLEEGSVDWRRGPARFAVATILGEYEQLVEGGADRKRLTARTLGEDAVDWLGKDFQGAIRRVIEGLPRGPEDFPEDDLEKQPLSPTLTRRSFVKAALAATGAGLAAGWLTREKPDAPIQAPTFVQPPPVTLPATPETDLKKRAVRFYALLDELLAMTIRNDSNKDAPDRFLRLFLEGYGANQWMKLSPDEKERFAKLLAELSVRPHEILEKVKRAVEANERNSGSAFNAQEVQQFLEELNMDPSVEVVVALLLKETADFYVRARVRKDGNGLAQINKQTLLDLWEEAKAYGLVEGDLEEYSKKPKELAQKLQEVLFDPTRNVELGILYLRRLSQRLSGELENANELTEEDRLKLILFAYNRGFAYVEGAIQAARKEEGALNFETISKHLQDPMPYRDKDGNLHFRQMSGDAFATGMDYAEVIWATAKLLRLLSPQEKPAAGLEEEVPTKTFIVIGPTAFKEINGLEEAVAELEKVGLQIIELPSNPPATEVARLLIPVMEAPAPDVIGVGLEEDSVLAQAIGMFKATNISVFLQPPRFLLPLLQWIDSQIGRVSSFQIRRAALELFSTAGLEQAA